jgi:hypothetical protein
MPGGINPPLEVILSWPKPNYVDPEQRSNTMLLVACICGPITIGLMLARLWVRIFHQRTSGWDDWLMLAATVCCPSRFAKGSLTAPGAHHCFDSASTFK